MKLPAATRSAIRIAAKIGLLMECAKAIASVSPISAVRNRKREHGGVSGSNRRLGLGADIEAIGSDHLHQIVDGGNRGVARSWSPRTASEAR